MDNRSPKQEKTVVYDGSVAGRRRPPAVPNYHLMTNNAVLPTGEPPAVEHYHTKVVRGGRRPKLQATLRKTTDPE